MVLCLVGQGASAIYEGNIGKRRGENYLISISTPLSLRECEHAAKQLWESAGKLLNKSPKVMSSGHDS